MNIPVTFLLWERYVYLASEHTLHDLLQQVQLCQHKPETGETRQQPDSSLQKYESIVTVT